MHTVFRFLRQLLLTVLLLALLTLVAAGGYFAVTGHKLYESAIQVTPIDTLYSSISSREGFVPYAQLPQTYINAVISAEDSRFTHHKGVDPVSIARALVTDLRTGSFAEGGSTITQQLAKNTLFTQEKHLARKAAEMFAALAIEKQYNKEQIFEMYVNTIYFGSGHYGIGEAAQGYFGKTPLQLTDAEAVMLAGLPNAPSAYSPNSSPDLAVKRMQVVLNRMVGCKKLTREQADALAAEAVTLQFLPASCSSLFSAIFRDAKSTAQREVDPLCGAFLRYLVWKRRNHVVPEKGFAAFPSGDSILPENFGKSVVHP